MGLGGGTHCISMGWDVPTKGVLFSVCLERGLCFIVKKNLGSYSNIPVWKGVLVLLERGVVNYLSLEKGIS